MLERSLILMATLLTFCASPVWADDEVADTSARDHSSEFLHQPLGQTFELTPSLALKSSAVTLKNTDTKYTVVGVPLTVLGEYGFNSMFSLGLQVGYQSGTTVVDCTYPNTCSNTTQRGLLDPVLVFKVKIPAGPGYVRTGANLDVAVEHNKVTASGDSNVATGGTTLTPYVGYELPVGRGILGARMTYDIYKNDAHVDSAVATGASLAYLRTGGKTLTANVFYEIDVSLVTIGAAAVYASHELSKLNYGGVSADEQNSAYELGLQIYAPLHFKNGITVLPMAQYTSTNYRDTIVVNSSNNFQIGCGGRFAF